MGSRISGLDVERTITDIWSEAFGQDKVAAGANFFEIGGDSLAAARVLTRIDDELGVQLPIVAQFEAPTVSQLAEVVRARMTASAPDRDRSREPRLEGSEPSQSLPATTVQWGLWLREQQFPGHGLSNLSLMWSFAGPIDIVAATAASKELIRRHDALRTVVRPDDNCQLKQCVVDSIVPPAIVKFDLTEASSREASALVNRLRHQPFKLDEAPLVRMSLLCGTRFGDVLLAVFHHAAYDDWSGGLIHKEFPELYESARSGTYFPAADAVGTYHEFMRYQQAWQSSPAALTARNYWERTLANAPLSMQLPLLDYCAPRGVSPVQAHFDPNGVVSRLPEPLVAEVRALARRRQVSTFILMLTAFKILVHRYTDQDDIVLPSIASGRNRQEFDRTVGWFVKMMPLRSNFGGNRTFLEVLRSVRDTTLRALDHQETDMAGGSIRRLWSEQGAMHGVQPAYNVAFQSLTVPYSHQSPPGLDTQPLIEEQRDSSESDASIRDHIPDGNDDAFVEHTNTARTELNTLSNVIIDVIDRGDGISLVALGIFHEPAVRRILASYEVLLSAIISDPTSTIGDLPLVEVEDRLSPVATRSPEDRCDLTVFRDAAARRDGQPAV